jgi:hypothetical protein
LLRLEEAIQEQIDDTPPSMGIEEAKRCTEKIRHGFQDARDNVLKIYQSKGWRSMGYESFQAWAQGEFKDLSWQQVYNLKAAAEIDNELALHSSSGEIRQIPINQAKELRKLKSRDKQLRAYQKAEVMAKAQGKAEPTAKIIEDAVYAVTIEEQVEDSPYPVVRQMFAENSLSASVAKSITEQLDRIANEPSIAYVQSLMAKYRLSNPELILAIGLRYKSERNNGKLSKVLDEIDRTEGYLAGTYLSKATMRDWKHACEMAQDEHIAEAEAAKRHAALLSGIILPVPIKEITLTLYEANPIKSAQILKKMLPPKDLEAVFHLLAKELGYVASEVLSEIVPSLSLPDAKFLQLDTNTDGIEDEQEYQVLFRVKPVEKKEEGDEHQS